MKELLKAEAATKESCKPTPSSRESYKQLLSELYEISFCNESAFPLARKRRGKKLFIEHTGYRDPAQPIPSSTKPSQTPVPHAPCYSHPKQKRCLLLPLE